MNIARKVSKNMKLGLFNDPAWIQDSPNIQDIVNPYLDISLWKIRFWVPLDQLDIQTR